MNEVTQATLIQVADKLLERGKDATLLDIQLRCSLAGCDEDPSDEEVTKTLIASGFEQTTTYWDDPAFKRKES